MTVEQEADILENAFSKITQTQSIFIAFDRLNAHNLQIMKSAIEIILESRSTIN